jgi:type II secretory pathway component PulF
MARFTYIAKKGPREVVKGDIDAENRDDAVNSLIQQGYVPIEVREGAGADKKVKTRPFSLKPSRRKVRSFDITFFTQQLASLVKSKVSVLESIGILSRQTENRYMKDILTSIYKELEDGKMFSDALNAYPKYFSPLYVNMIRAGEIGGVLEESLTRLSDFREEEEEMKATVTSALAYPIFIFVVGIITIIMLVTFAVPRLIVLFEESGQSLPFVTQVLVSTAKILRSYWYLLLIILAGVIILFKRKGIGEKEKIAMDRIKFRLPVFGELIKKEGLARFSRSFGVLLGTGIPVLQAIKILILTVDNEIFKIALRNVEKSIVDGESLAKGIEYSAYFPPFMINMIAVGEKGGHLEQVLLEIAHFYEREVRKITKIVTSLLEPAIILVMGLIVGFIVFAMLLPIFEINLSVR